MARALFASIASFVLVASWPCSVRAAPADGAPDFPSKPIRLIVPAGPGSSNDTMARVLGLRLGEALGRTIVVDNRPGAGGIIGTEIVSKSAPDGYTLLTVSTASVIFPQLHKKLGFDPFKDFVPIAQFGVMQNAFVVTPSLTARNVKEFIAITKSKPGQLNMASAGAGSQSHLAGVQFLVLAGIDVVHVPFRDGGASVAGVMANQAQFAVTPLPAVVVHVKAGRLRALGTGGEKRSAQLPDVPTISEAGLAGYRSTGWMGLEAPKGTSRAVVEKLHRTLAKVMAQPETRELMERQGAEAVTSTPAEFTSFIRQEWDRFGPVIKAAGLKVE